MTQATYESLSDLACGPKHCNNFLSHAWLLPNGRAFVTDGRVLLILAQTIPGAPPIDDRPKPASFDKLIVPHGEQHSVSYSTLAKWIGDPPPKPKTIIAICSECAGSCEVQCDSCGQQTECLACNGKGKFETLETIEPRVGGISGIFLDLNLLADYFQFCSPVETVNVWTNTDPIYFDGGEWLLIIKPLAYGNHEAVELEI